MRKRPPARRKISETSLRLNDLRIAVSQELRATKSEIKEAMRELTSYALDTELTSAERADRFVCVVRRLVALEIRTTETSRRIDPRAEPEE